MKRRTQKLLCLNLSLLLLLSAAAAPTYALGDGSCDVLCAMESGCADGTLDYARPDRFAAPEDVTETAFYEQEPDASPALLSAAELNGASGYDISVGGARFPSEQAASGSGWTYSPEDHSLSLDNYNGGTISASGDLVIYTSGNCYVSGSSGTYGGNAIEVSGESEGVGANLDLHIESGTLSVTAGSGSISGGDAVSVDGVLYCSCQGAASFTGGASTGTEYRGGDALYGGSAVILSGSRITATGGSANTSSAYQLSGGDAISSPVVYVFADCTLRGGAGYYGGSAVYFTSYCEFGVVNATVSSGGAGSAILWPGDLTWYYHPHTTPNGYNHSFTITVNRYTLTLYGNGGTLFENNRPSLSMTAPYPTSHCLSDFFSRSGYTQVAWGTVPGELRSAPTVQETWTDAEGTSHTAVWETWTASSLIPYNAWYQPAKDTTLYAKWVPTGANDILLNGLGGTFPDGTAFRKTTGTAVKLPDMLSYPAAGSPTISDDGSLIVIRPTQKNRAVLAWTDTPAASSGELHLYEDAPFYVGGDVVTPNASAATVLYAWESDGLFARYHATLGTLRQGGSILLQGEAAASATSLKTYVPDGSRLIAPENYEFAGWSLREDASTLDYLPGEPITLRKNTMTPSDVTDLYAVWIPAQLSKELADGITLTQNFKEERLIVSLSDQWCRSSGTQRLICALYDAGRLVQIAGGSLSAQGISVSLPYSEGSYDTCKVFALDANQRPTREQLSFVPEELWRDTRQP